MSPRRWVLVALAAAAIVLVAGRALASLRVDHAWYGALGLTALARANLAGAVLVRGGTTVLATLFLFANLYAVRRSVVSLVLPRQVGDLEFGEEVPGRYLVAVAAAIAIVVGSLLGIDGHHWPRFALGIEGVVFGERDPYYEHDIGFYVAWLPAELLLFGWMQRLLVVAIVVTVVLYALTPSIRWRGRTLYVSEYVRRHLTVLGGVLLLVFAWAFRLDTYQLLMAGSGPGGAFSALDMRVNAPGSLVLAATSLGAGLLVIWAGFAGQVRLAFLAVSVMLLLSVVVRWILPVALRPGETHADVVRPFLETRAGFTRRAFGADRVVTARASPGDSSFVLASVRDVAIWDAPALRRAIDGAAGLGWQPTSAGITALVAQRGFVEDGETTPWTVTRVAAWTADVAGEPVATRATTSGTADVLAPVVVAGDAPSYRIVSDPAGLIAGSPAASWASRLAHAWALQNFRILLGSLPPSPTVVLRPQVHDRVAAVAPFLVQGDAAYPAVAGDTLYWIVELYTASGTYPLSEPFTFAGEQRRYFHPAGHAVVNSATGLVRVVPVAQDDPVLRAWMRRFPELFLPVAALPGGLQHALAPHAEAARARAMTFARLGRSAREAPAGRRHLVLEHGADTVLAGAAPPLVLRGAPGLTLVVPLLDERDRVAGVVATSGSGSTSQWIPAAGDAPAWESVLDGLRAVDSTAARRDARPVRGRVRVLPTSEGLVYAQPTFLWPSRGEPTLASVSTLTADGPSSASVLRLGPRLSAAPMAEEPPPSPRSTYLRMREALRRGDWATFGALLDTLGHALDARPR